MKRWNSTFQLLVLAISASTLGAVTDAGIGWPGVAGSIQGAATVSFIALVVIGIRSIFPHSTTDATLIRRVLKIRGHTTYAGATRNGRIAMYIAGSATLLAAIGGMVTGWGYAVPFAIGAFFGAAMELIGLIETHQTWPEFVATHEIPQSSG
jgi:amino acid transporter